MASQTLSLSEVTNTYGTYRGNSLVGERGAVGTVPNDGLEGIVGVNAPNTAGILIKINEQIFADSTWLQQLRLASNPYISKRSLPMVTLNLSDLLQTHPNENVYGSVTELDYSEATFTALRNTNDIFYYLNDFFNENTTDVVLPDVPGGGDRRKAIGNYNLFTTAYDVEQDRIGAYPGLQFEEQGDTGIKVSVPSTEPIEVPEPPVVEVEPPKEVVVIKPPVETIPIKTQLGIKISPSNPTPVTGGSGTGRALSTIITNPLTGEQTTQDTFMEYLR